MKPVTALLQLALVPCDELVASETLRRVLAYLPRNYKATTINEGVLIVGRDVAGWTLRDYVIPRLASGLITAIEVDTSLTSVTV